MRPFPAPEVAKVFEGCPPVARRRLLALRELIYETAASMRDVGELEETLKWGEPAYLTTQSKSGSTIRIAWKKSAPEKYAVYFNCNTTLIDTFRSLFPNDFEFEGNRAIVFDLEESVPLDSLTLCIAAALTYHR